MMKILANKNKLVPSGRKCQMEIDSKRHVKENALFVSSRYLLYVIPIYYDLFTFFVCVLHLVVLLYPFIMQC